MDSQQRPRLGPLRVHRLGLVEYEDGLELQRQFGKARSAGNVPDTLLLLQHTPVLTLGRSAKRQNVIAGPELLAKLGVELHETNRGGDVTYHGPGQIVGYPIVQLPPGRHDVRRYVRDLEEALIRTLAHYGVTAGRIPRWTGVWIGEDGDPSARKIGALGVHLSRWQTSHGFALNVNTDLSHFRLIVPCGIQEAGVTSLERELGRKVDLDEVQGVLARELGLTLEGDPEPSPEPTPTISVAVLRARAGAGPEVLLLKRTAERGGFWQLPTGRVESGESAADAAVREVEEETGQRLGLRPLDYVHAFAFGDDAVPRVFRETAFVGLWPGEAPVRLSAEHDESAWLSPQEALGRLPYAGLRAALRRGLATLSR